MVSTTPTKEADEFLRKVHTNPFYHGLRSRARVEENLTEKGSFLFRMIKARKNEVVLSIGLGANSEAKFAHIPITFNQTAKLWELQVLFGKKGKASSRSQMEKQPTCEGGGGGGGNQGVNKKGLHFSSLEQLVKYYGEPRLICGVSLRNGVRRPRWFLQQSTLRYNTKDFLGKGHYCQVIKGKIRGKPETVVAIKMLHDSENDQQQTDIEKDEGRDAMFREAEIMAKCMNRYIVSFYGVQCDIPPVMIVMEYCPGGSLDNHLQKEKENITDGERLTYCREAARGMKYLHFHHIVHRDLAARNCLIAANGVVKISDFGLSRTTDRTDTMDVVNVPLRWMAPETLSRTPVFSTKSDIWSFGVLLYEIYNLGIKPWADEEDQRKIGHMIRHGPMPDLPDRTPPAMKELIRQCWNVTSSQRPEFRDIVKLIVKMFAKTKMPKPDEFSVNRLPGVYREEVRTISEEGERSILVQGADIHTPPLPTTSEETGSRDTVSHEAKAPFRNSGEECTRAIRDKRKPKTVRKE